MGTTVSCGSIMATSTASNSNSTSTTQQQQHSSAITLAIRKLKDLGINFLALDFDQTILDIHTGGYWKGSMEELFPHVRPVFCDLIQAAVAHDIQVAVVTFSVQTPYVRGVLDYICGIQASQQIPIRGGDRSWQYKGSGASMMEGKQSHMASAVEELESRCGDGDDDDARVLEISKNTTLLIDDDARNIRAALRDGTRALWFNPKKPHLLLQDIMKLV
jgi:hypothetical protein